MTDEELIALADALEQMEGMKRRDDEVLDQAAAAIRALVAERGK